MTILKSLANFFKIYQVFQLVTFAPSAIFIIFVTFSYKGLAGFLFTLSKFGAARKTGSGIGFLV